jgi:pectate lyase
MSERSPYYELIKPELYLQQFADSINKLNLGEDTISVSIDDMHHMWVDNMMVSKSGFFKVDSDNEEELVNSSSEKPDDDYFQCMSKTSNGTYSWCIS